MACYSVACARVFRLLTPAAHHVLLQDVHSGRGGGAFRQNRRAVLGGVCVLCPNAVGGTSRRHSLTVVWVWLGCASRVAAAGGLDGGGSGLHQESVGGGAPHRQRPREAPVPGTATQEPGRCQHSHRPHLCAWTVACVALRCRTLASRTRRRSSWKRHSSTTSCPRRRTTYGHATGARLRVACGSRVADRCCYNVSNRRLWTMT